MQTTALALPATQVPLHFRNATAAERIDRAKRREERLRLGGRLRREQPTDAAAFDRFGVSDARRAQQRHEVALAKHQGRFSVPRLELAQSRQQADEIAERSREHDERAAGTRTVV